MRGEKIIKANEKKGLSFCRTISKFVEVAKFKAKRSKNSLEDIHVYKINENVELPKGLAFYKDKPGHVSNSYRRYVLE